MSDVEAFESMLKEVVNAKRLSASKVSKLTEIALQNMQNDTQLVSILYRTHKSLPPAAKIHSLYAFDALSRAARSQVNKQSLTGDISTVPGNSATFLLKVDGVLDGLIQDMVTLDHPDAKEKTKKILDIWTKSNTFPSAVLARLSNLLKGSGKKVDPQPVKTAVTRDPRQQHLSPPSATTPPTSTTPPQTTIPPTLPTPVPAPPPPAISAPENVQSALLALLSQAANVAASTNGQTAANTTQLDANQLALFQQLTQAAKAAGNVPTQPVHLPVSLVPSATANAVPLVAPPFGGPSQSLPYRDDHFGAGRRDPQYDRHDGGFDRGRNRDVYYDDRRDSTRGDFRGGFPHRGGAGFRGRGRGRWDDRERFPPRNQERDWDLSRTRDSRSRSPGPPRGPAGRRDDRFSPQSRPISTYMSDSPPDTSSRLPPVASSGGTDEFGRALREESPREHTPPAPGHVIPPPHSQSPQENGMSSSIFPPTLQDTSEKPPEAVELSTHPSVSPAIAPSSSSSSTAASSQSGAGLNGIDMSAFNPTDPSAWKALGIAWTETRGTIPSQEELMQYVMTSMSGGNMGMPGGASAGGSGYAVQNGYDVQQQQQQQPKQFAGQGGWSAQGQGQSWGYPGRGRGRGRGRGGYGFGNARGGQWGHYGGGRGNFTETDAITLGGGDEDTAGYGAGYSGRQDSDFQSNQGAAYTTPTQNGSFGNSEMSHGSEGSGGDRAGTMQRVGDRWVFVRGGQATAPAAEVA